MTSLKGDLRSIMGTPFGGVGHAVLIFSRVTRAAFNSDSVVLQLHDRIEMPEEANGKFQVDGLDPGPIRIELEGGTVHNHGWNIDLPDEGVWSLTDLVDAQVDWSPAVIGRAEAAARESREHADRAEAGADRVGTAEQVGVWASEASASASDASSARSGAVTARNAAQSARDAAEGHANRAATSESNAATSETNAKQSEDNAGDYAAVATTAAVEAVEVMSGKADEQDVASIRDRLSAIEPVDSEHSEGTEWVHAAGDGTRLPLGYTPEGRLDDFARQVWSEDVIGLHEVSYDRQYARVYTTPEGHVLAAILRDGSVEIPRLKATTAAPPPVVGGGFARLEKYRHTDGTLAPVMADTAHIAGWGSSSMEGMTSAITGALSGLPTTYHNFAKGGEWIEHNAARMGAIPALVEPVTIPANGSVAVTVDNVPANANMRPFTGHLSGVHGTLSSTTTDFTFTRTTPGDPITLSGTTEFIPDIDPDVLNHTTILQLGKNNFVVPTVVEDVSRISSTMLAYLRPLMARVLILGHHANANWGTEAYSYMRDRLARVNDNMRALAGDDHFIDVHRIVTGDEIWTRTGITPTAEDLEAQSLGILAPSLRVDGAHFNGATNQALADIIRERIDYLNWY